MQSSISKRVPDLVCFVHFDFEMCFVPQRRARFQHLIFQKCSDVGVLYVFTSNRASRRNCVQFFISHLPRWLRTRRFSEPTFRPSGATSHWKNTVFRDFPTFHAPGSSFFLDFVFFDLLSSSLLFSSLTLPTCAFPSVHIVGSLTSKLPSVKSHNLFHNS